MNIIEQIHASDIYGIFVETGCGVTMTNKLMEVPGASNTIYYSESPYSKEYQQEKYNTDGKRAVSIDTIIGFLSYVKSAKMSGDPGFLNNSVKKINTTYAATFQIGDMDNVLVLATHGYIGISYKDLSLIFHVSIHERLSRKEYLDKIGDIGVRILYSLTLGNNTHHIPEDCNIDAAYDVGTDWKVTPVPLHKMYRMLVTSKNENFVCVDQKGEYKRLDEFFREKKQILLYKGSFNPIHIAHLKFAEIAKEKMDDWPVFMISLEIYKKDPLNPFDMEKRVMDLIKLGYRVIVSKSGWFHENVEYLHKKFPTKPIVFIVGTDTINRIFESTYNIIGQKDQFMMAHQMGLFANAFENVKFLVINRDSYPLAAELKETMFLKYYDYVPISMDVSSTKIRELKDNGNIDEANKFLPDQLKIK